MDEDVFMSFEGERPVLPMGWALKSATGTRKNLTDAQKNYLAEVFQEGERTGQKADPTNISKATRRANTEMAPVSLKRTTSSHLCK